MPRNPRLPDTNSILRYVLKDHREQFEVSQEFFEKVRTGKDRAILSESVLVECVYVLSKFYRVPKKEASEILSRLLLYKGVRNKDKEVLFRALSIFSDKSVDIVDCILLARSRQENVRLFSFDKGLKKLEQQQ